MVKLIRDSIGLIVALFFLIVTFSVTSYFIFDLFDSITSQNSDIFFVSLNTILKSAYTMVYVILGLGIFYWYFNRMHREEHEPDYFAEAGYRFETPRVPDFSNVWRRKW